MRKLFFILLICNMLFVNAQSLELENWKIINSSELNAGAAEVSQLSYPTAGWYQYCAHYRVERFGEGKRIS